ncbi:MAG: DNA repair protein RadC [Erysipelotrichaceae bacterium]|nr:DNA repair protein RadC [Erysipelotrichaceae bacterium]MDY5251746.1 DNA repair protein RadC [Erysipelotrichaceae bacterium]
MLIKDLPELEKPREKALKYGLEHLSNNELLALIIRNGYQNTSSIQIAQDLILKANGIANINSLCLNDLCSIKGIKTVKALELKACFELARRMALHEVSEQINLDQPSKIVKWLQLELGHKSQEHFLVIFLNGMCQYIAYKVLFVGTINKSNIYSRDIIDEALKNKAVNIILVHNHPSKVLRPSQADKEATMMIMKAMSVVNIMVLDHIIISNNDYFSFKEHCLI